MNEPHKPVQLDDTQEFAPFGEQKATDGEDLDKWTRKKPTFKRQEVVEEEGRQYLVIRSLEQRRFPVETSQIFSRRNHGGNRQSLRIHYRVHERRLLLLDSVLVNPKLAMRISGFSPGEDETTIHTLYRKSMFSFILLPIFGVCTWLLCLVMYWIYSSDRAVLLSLQLTIGFIAVVAGGTAAYAWLYWAPHIYFTTDDRYTRQFRPPLLLPGYVNPVLLRDVTSGFTAKDHSWMANWLGNWSFGTIMSDTAADKGDEWMNRMTFIRYHDLVADKLNELRTRS